MMNINDGIIRFINKAIKKRGNPPTLREIREIGKRFGISHVAAGYHITKLEKEGRIKTRIAVKKRASRSIKILKKIKNV